MIWIVIALTAGMIVCSLIEKQIRMFGFGAVITVWAMYLIPYIFNVPLDIGFPLILTIATLVSYLWRKKMDEYEYGVLFGAWLYYFLAFFFG